MKKKLLSFLLLLSSVGLTQAGFWDGVKNFFKETGTFVGNTVKGAGKVVASPFRGGNKDKKVTTQEENKKKNH
jgi:predicted small secreted protein